jgi:hypothetical protein
LGREGDLAEDLDGVKGRDADPRELAQEVIVSVPYVSIKRNIRQENLVMKKNALNVMLI